MKTVQKGQFPHTEWVDLLNNGVAVEVIVIKRDNRNGDFYYIRVDHLDDIDRRRMLQILRKRDADKYPLWDLLDNTTLGNGENALEYFHQLVRVVTESGEILTPSHGRTGIANVSSPLDVQPKKTGRPPNNANQT